MVEEEKISKPYNSWPKSNKSNMESELGEEERKKAAINKKRQEILEKPGVRRSSESLFLYIKDKEKEEEREEGSGISLTDQYGFCIKMDDALDKEDKRLKKRDNARMVKWIEMLENFKYYYTKHLKKVKKRVRKGIPDCIRGEIWIIFTHVRESKAEYPGIYSKIIELDTCKYEGAISKDIHRTFPKHIFFKCKSGKGQLALFNVLKALSIRFPEAGYVQGMGFIAGMILTYLSEEDTFWAMVAIIENYNMKRLYLDKMIGLPLALYKWMILFKKYLPSLYRHFLNLGLTPQMYATNWFVTNFTATFPFELNVRIWDCFLCENHKIIFRIPLAFFKLREKQLLAMDFEHILMLFKTLWNGISVECVMKTAHSFKFSRKLLKKCDKEYINSPQADIIKYCK